MALAVGALGVVFGDIGTSPLYAMREALAHSRADVSAELSVLGLVSLITWALILVVTLKYVALIMRAANKGDAFGERYMGMIYANGWGVPQDKREAARWWAKSAAQGNENAIKGLRMLAAAGVPEAAAALRRLRLAP